MERVKKKGFERDDDWRQEIEERDEDEGVREEVRRQAIKKDTE